MTWQKYENWQKMKSMIGNERKGETAVKNSKANNWGLRTTVVKGLGVICE